MGLQGLRFAKTAVPETNQGRQLDGLVYREVLAETGRACARPSSRLKKMGHERQSRRPMAVTAAFVAGLLRETNPDLAHHEAKEM
jgi:hypothetical protein